MRKKQVYRLCLQCANSIHIRPMAIQANLSDEKQLQSVRALLDRLVVEAFAFLALSSEIRTAPSGRLLSLIAQVSHVLEHR
jgi:hypothetical protein